MKIQVNYIGALLCMLFIVSGCGPKTPEISPSDVTKAYLDAMKLQNSEEMAKYSLSGISEDFTLTSEEVATLGMDATSAQNFMTHILNFQYELDGESIYLNEESATVTIKLNTFDVNGVVNQAVETNKEKFNEISSGKESTEVKQKQISDIIIAAFDSVEPSMEKSYTIQLKIKDEEWKVKDLDEGFYNTLLNIE